MHQQNIQDIGHRALMKASSSPPSPSLVTGATAIPRTAVSARRASRSLVSASSTPPHASRSTRSSSRPRVCSFTPLPLPASDESCCPPGAGGAGSPTPCGGGTNPAGGAVRTAGEMRAARMCAREERRAICMLCVCESEGEEEGEGGDARRGFPSICRPRRRIVRCARRPVGARRLVRQFGGERGEREKSWRGRGGGRCPETRVSGKRTRVERDRDIFYLT